MVTMPTPQPTPESGAIIRGSFTASQLGTMLSLVAAGVLYIWHQGVDFQRGWNPLEHIQEIERVFSIQFYLILWITALYYVISEWVVEETDSTSLRTLRCATIEFWLRAILAVLLVVLAEGFPTDFDKALGLTHIHTQALGLAAIYWLFLFWDFMVTRSGHNLAGPLLAGDFLGGLLTLLVLWCHWRWPFYGLILLVGMLVFNGVLMVDSARKFHLLKRVFDRQIQK